MKYDALSICHVVPFILCIRWTVIITIIRWCKWKFYRKPLARLCEWMNLTQSYVHLNVLSPLFNFYFFSTASYDYINGCETVIRITLAMHLYVFIFAFWMVQKLVEYSYTFLFARHVMLNAKCLLIEWLNLLALWAIETLAKESCREAPQLEKNCVMLGKRIATRWLKICDSNFRVCFSFILSGVFHDAGANVCMRFW